MKRRKTSAVLLYGIVHRSLRYTVGSLRKCLIAPLEKVGPVELYFHSWDTRLLNNPRAREEAEVDPADVRRFLPEGIGGIDSEQAFDRGVDWRALDGINKSAFQSETHAGRVSFRNIIRTLESLERVWHMFSMSDTGGDGLVVATRADLRFAQPLCVESLREGTIGIPDFHGWGGVNDRFAVGTRQHMEIYCRRRAFYEQQLANTHLKNPESILAAWLTRNAIDVQDLDLPFQRVRADGRVYHRDLPLAPAE